MVLPLSLVSRSVQTPLGQYVGALPLVTIGVGNPPQLLSLILDSGSYCPVVYNASCSCGNVPGSARFFPASSSTSIVSDIGTTLSYAAGKMSGVWAVDTLWMSPPGLQPEVIMAGVNFTLALVSDWIPSQDINLFGGSGILGMGPIVGSPSIGPVPHTGASLLAAGVSLYATWVPRGLNFFKPGMLQLGGYDALPLHGMPPTWTRRISIAGNSNQYWMLVVDDVLVNGNSTKVCSSSNVTCIGLLDTGASVIILAGAVTKKFPSVIPCSDISTLPIFTVVVAGTSFTFEPQDYMTDTGDACRSVLLTGNFPSSMERHWDLFQFQSAGNNRKTILLDLGVVFSSRVTTIFDWKSDRIGLIQHD